jgi:protein subunit release factor A
MANHNINVNLRNGKGKSKTSANGSVQKISQRMSGSSSTSAKNLAKGLRTLRTLDFGNMGLFGGTSGASMAIAQEVMKTAYKVADLRLDWLNARTGDSISIGNTKKAIRLFQNPTNIISESYGAWIQSVENDRANKSNDYYRELSGNLIIGNQYGIKK